MSVTNEDPEAYKLMMELFEGRQSADGMADILGTLASALLTIYTVIHSEPAGKAVSTIVTICEDALPGLTPDRMMKAFDEARMERDRRSSLDD